MAKQNPISPEEQARLDEEALLAQIAAEEEAKKKAEADAKAEEEAKAKSESDNASPEEQADLDEKREHKIVVLQNTQHLKKDNEHVVSGNVANILIKRGIAKLVETMPEKSKINP
jgi:membrane protein involved in colicin uptake